MKKTKKALASIAIAGMTLSMIPFNAFAATTTTRIAGMTAEQTAVKIADQTGYTGTAILASSTSYGMVDALTAGPLAASLKAPILLTGAGNTLNADTKAELTKLAVKKVYVTSGTAVIKAGVIDELKAMGIEVVALGGFDRAETSVNIAKQMTGVTKVAVANGVPDALSIASVASAANQPILLTNKDMLPSSVAAYLATAGVTSTDVIGGTGVISDAVVAGLPGATRHFGMTAYDTNNQVVQDFAAALEFDNVYVANGQTGIDALAGAPLAAQTKSAIVLTDGKSVPAAAAFTYGKSPAGAVVTALGGEAVVPESVRMGVAAGQVTTDPNTAPLAIVSVSALTDDGRVLDVAFNKAYSGAIDKSIVKVFNSKSLSRVGVESVQLSSNGMSLEVSFYDTEEADEIDRLVDYTITVGSLEFTFSRPMYLDIDDNARITKVDSDEREFTVTSDKKGTYTLEVPETLKVNFQEILGQNVRVWWNADDEVINMEIQSEAIYDAIEFTEVDELETVDEEVEYDLADDVKLFVNDDSAKVVKGDIYDYAKVIFNEDGDVAYIYAYTFAQPIIVEEVNDDYIVDYDGAELDMEDYIIVKDGKQIAISDIEEGDLVFFSKDANDEDGYAVVYNNTVTGEIDNVYKDSFDLDGENYKYSTSRYTAQYLNEDNDKDILDDNGAEKLQAGGDVIAYFNFEGDVVLVKGSEGVVDAQYATTYTTDAIEAYKDTKGNARITLEVVDQDGDTEVLDFAVDSLDKVEVQRNGAELEFEDGEDSLVKEFEIDEFGITNFSGVVDTEFTIQAEAKNDADTEDVVDVAGPSIVGVAKDDNGNVTGLKFYETDKTLIDIDYDNSYAAGKRLQDSTIVIGVDVALSAMPDDDEVSFYTWGDLSEDGTDLTDATVFYDEDDKVTHILVADLEAGETTDQTALLTRVDVNTDDEIVRVKAFVNGKEETYTVDNVDHSTEKKGDVVVLVINDNSGEVDKIKDVDQDDNGVDQLLVDKKVTKIDVSKSQITLDGGKVVELESGGQVYDASDSSYSSEGLRDIEVGDVVTVALVAEGSKFADVIVIVTGATEEDDDVVVGDPVTYVVTDYNTTFERFDIEDKYGDASSLFVADFDGFVFTDGTDDVEVTESVMTDWLNTGTNGADLTTIVVQDNVLVVEDATATTGNLDQQAVNAEVNNYVATATIAKATATDADVTDSVVALAEGKEATVGITVAATAVGADDLLTLTGDVVSLTAQLANGATDNETTVTVTFTKGGKTATKTVTVTIEKQDA